MYGSFVFHFPRKTGIQFKERSDIYLVLFAAPTSQSKEIVHSLIAAGRDVSFCEIESPCGHDAFLLEFETQTKIVKSFLSKSRGVLSND